MKKDKITLRDIGLFLLCSALGYFYLVIGLTY